MSRTGDIPAIKVRGRSIGAAPPFIIAEMSGNHNGSISRALEIVDAAAAAGVDALKLQTYTADTMTLDVREREFRISNPKSPWHGETLYQLYRRAHTPWDWHRRIFDRCRRRGILGFSTPFDATAVDFLESLDAPMYKVASFEIVDLPLIRRISTTRKPIIISTGMASLAELDDAVRAARGRPGAGLILLKCTSAYPADPGDSNLSTIPHMRDLFRVHVGISDHTLGIAAAVTGVALGASVIEKHFTLSRKDGGVDSSFSMEPDEMRDLVREAKAAWRCVGTPTYGPGPAELGSLRHRRSLYVTQDLPAGAVLSSENVRAIRPGLGLPPKHLDAVLGRKLRHAVKRGTPVRWRLLA